MTQFDGVQLFEYDASVNRSLFLLSFLLSLLLSNCAGEGRATSDDFCALANAHAATHLKQWNQTTTFFHQQPVSWMESEELAYSLTSHPFERETGKTITLSFKGDTWEEAETVNHQVDVSAFQLEGIGEGRSLDLRTCNSLIIEAVDEPRRNKMVQQLQSTKNVDTVLLAVWPPALSSDERKALVYAETYCGEACAGGTIWLYEKRTSGWTLQAWQNVWVS